MRALETIGSVVLLIACLGMLIATVIAGSLILLAVVQLVEKALW